MSFTAKKLEPLVTQKLTDWGEAVEKKKIVIIRTQGNFFINAMSVSIDPRGNTPSKSLQTVVQAELSHHPEMGY